MYSRVYKNYQVNVGLPFCVKTPVIIENGECNGERPEGELASSNNAEKIAEKHLRAAKERADMIIREAKLEAEKIIQQAYADAEKKKIEVLEEARKKGYDKGYAEGRQQYEHLIEEAEKIKENSLREYRQTLESLEADIIGMVLDVAKKVVGREIQTDKSIVLELVKEAFAKCMNREKAILKVSPEDYKFVEEHKEEILSAVEGLEDFDIKEDSSMQPGSCIVETPFGNVDSGVNTKIGKVEEIFMQAVGR